MPYSHYPKIVGNIVLAWVQPPPPDVPPGNGLPDFLGCSFSTLNSFRKPIAPDEVVVGHHDAQPFTRFYGSIACDQPLDVDLTFSNDEVSPDGHWVTDENINSLKYDALGMRQRYEPKKQELTGKFFTVIFGRWICVSLRNVGDQETTFLRFYVRGSVF